MTNKEKLQEILEAHDRCISDAARAVYAGPAALAIYAIELGLNQIKARKRATDRREIRREVRPEYKPGRTSGSITLTPKAKKRLVDATTRLFSKDGWNIGDLNISAFTREDLLEQAARERRSAKGHIRNAQFYEALAEPMAVGQRVGDYWKQADALKVKEEVWRETENKQPDLVA